MQQRAKKWFKVSKLDKKESTNISWNGPNLKGKIPLKKSGRGLESPCMHCWIKLGSLDLLILDTVSI